LKPMPFLKMHTQFVWSTKNKIPFLAIKEVRKIIWNHIRENANKDGIRLDFINGYTDHYHCIIALEADQTIENVLGRLNDGKTFWIDKKGISTESFSPGFSPILAEINNKFDWQDDYFVIAVSESVFKRVSSYVQNQLADNSKKLFDNEYDDYVIKYGFQEFSV